MAKLPDVKQKVAITDGYKKPLADIRANIGKTKAHFKSLGKEIKAISRSGHLKNLKNNISQVRNAAAGIGTGFAQSARRAAYSVGLVGGAIGGLVYKTASYGDNIAKTAKRLNIGVQALQEYRHAADLSSIPLDKFELSMLKFQKRTAEAVKGIGYGKEMFKKLGIQLTESNGKIRNTEVLFAELADKLIAMEDTTKRTRYALEIFGRKGADMVLMMQKGSKGIREMREDARRLGGIMTEKDAKASEDFIDTIARTKQVIGGVVRSLGFDLMPIVSDLFKSLQHNIKIYRPQLESFFRGLVEAIPRVIGKMISLFRTLKEKLTPIFDWLKNVINTIGWERSALFGLAVFVGGPLIASLAGLVPMIGGIVGAIRAAIPIVRAFWLALAGGPVGWIIAGIAALTVAVVVFRKELMPVYTAIKSAFNPVIEEMKALIDEVSIAFKSLTDLVGATGLGGTFRWLGTVLVDVLAFLAKVHIKMALLPIRQMIAGVRLGIKIWTGMLNVWKAVVDFIKETFAPQLDWIGKKFDWLSKKGEKFLGIIRDVIGKGKKFAKTLGISTDEERVIQYQEKDMGGAGGRRSGLSGRQLTDQISELGDPRYGPSLQEQIRDSGGVGGVSTQQLLNMTNAKGKSEKNHLQIDFRNMPRGTDVVADGDSDIDINTGYAFGGV